jgi:two-component system chemotaxis response regulator CheY
MSNILIVDDSHVMRKNLKTILSEAGHTIVAEAVNGAQAYKEYNNHLPDLVTMDITMPFMNGVDALKKIIHEFPDAKIVIVSIANNNKVILEAMQCGASNYVLKPFTVEKVIRVVNQVLHINDQMSRETIERIYKSLNFLSL